MNAAPNYRKLFEALPGLYLVLSPELVILGASDAFLGATMTERGKIMNRGVFEVFPDNPEDPAATGERNVRESLRKVLANRVADILPAQKFDIRRAESEGGGFVERFWTAVNFPIFDTAGAIACIVQQLEDVTAEQKTESDFRGALDGADLADGAQNVTLAKLKESQERYELALKGSNDGLWDWDVVNNKLFWSDRFKEMLEITDRNFQPSYDQLKGRLHPDERDNIIATLERHTKKRTAYDAEFRMRTESGRYIWARSRGASLWNEDGRAIRMTGSVTDITDRKLAEQALEEALKQAETANQAKSDFLAHMSHELRTPLNSIIGLTRLLYEERTMPDDHREMIGVACRSAGNLLDIVNDILDLSKIEERELILEKIVFALEDQVDTLMETMLPLGSGKGLKLGCNFSGDKLPYLVGDPLRLGRIMVNLVGNAVKYTPEGAVTVNITCEPEGDRKRLLEFSVTDTGIGIPRDKQETVFGKFAQADSSITRKFGGTGLGLYITKQLVEKMGGVVGLESEEGKGSRFWFRIPFTTAEMRPLADRLSALGEHAERLPPEQRTAAREIRVLVAEDHPLNREFMQRLLPRMDIAHFEFAENGQEALEAFRAKSYGLILMDCHMPELSGYDAAGAIREIEKDAGGHIPIVAMTADAMLGTRERTLKAGMDDYISKPVDVAALRRIMSRWITFSEEHIPEHIKGSDIAPNRIPDQTPGQAPDKTPGQISPADLSTLREFARNEEELRRYVDMFITQSEEILRALAANCTAGENKAWTEAAHKLKGGASMVKAEKLRTLCERAQAMASASAGERQEIFEALGGAYGEAAAWLRQALGAEPSQNST